ncbi:uncharacterized protein BCR38DRAFT_480193 [Pseudomassariella vexata]|uniref:STE24 endopeptidase n=1 Tax=Pseudomassariella vexata TaxID=1141098 RepID=A0A1Y2EK91_9PEZI|nr:uncharacterized protein BCR38DRAFT_480193 [Pseudomassariella vexata]ORY71704.1 hypothetical protein BCR38DRAFT_480193 [Pseudomassariella vexata]
MPTPIDNVMRSKNAVLGFAGLVAAASVWAFWGGDVFPAQPDPKGDPENWTWDEMRRWLAAVTEPTSPVERYEGATAGKD